MIRHTRRTKIIATLGPASSTYETIEALFLSGADVFRLNFSHGDHASHQKNIKSIRTISKKYNHPIGIIGDLQGPKLRIGDFEDPTPLILHAGDIFALYQYITVGSKSGVTLAHPEVFDVATPGTQLLINDGRVRLEVMENQGDTLICCVKTGGEISSRKGVNIPGVHLPISAITEKDKRDLDFMLDEGVDWVALSFVQTPDDIRAARTLIADRARLAAKIEKPLALQYLDEITQASDSIMIARGDLGVELPLEDVPILQKRMISRARYFGKPVIVATQMLESMISAPTPTRAEVSDVAGAIYEHVDCVTLSAESASGQYPVEAVTMMDHVIHHTERDIHDRGAYTVCDGNEHTSISNAITSAARAITYHLDIKAIVTLTETGRTVYDAARERPHAPLIACSKNQRTLNAVCLSWGAYGILMDAHNTSDEDIVQKLMEHQVVCSGDTIVVTSGVPFQRGTTHMLKILTIA